MYIIYKYMYIILYYMYIIFFCPWYRCIGKIRSTSGTSQFLDCDGSMYYLQGKVVPQGATIVKLVTTQTAGGVARPTTVVTTQASQTPSTILGISSVQPQVHF